MKLPGMPINAVCVKSQGKNTGILYHSVKMAQLSKWKNKPRWRQMQEAPIVSMPGILSNNFWNVFKIWLPQT